MNTMTKVIATMAIVASFSVQAVQASPMIDRICGLDDIYAFWPAVGVISEERAKSLVNQIYQSEAEAPLIVLMEQSVDFAYNQAESEGEYREMMYNYCVQGDWYE